MRAVAKFAMRSPMAASISAAAYAVFALFFAPFMVISGAIVGLSTLRFGAGGGLRVAGGAMVVAGIAYFSLLHSSGAIVFLMGMWVPLLAIGQVLRVTKNQGFALTACGIGAAAYTLVVRLIIPDVQGHWAQRLEVLGATVRDQGGTFFGDDELQTIAAVMHESTIVVVGLFWISAILVARWWQSTLYNPGGFGVEFRQLQIPKPVSLIAALVAVKTLLQISGGSNHGLANDLLVVLVILFAFQGLAIIHHRVNKVGLAKVWLVGFYLLLVLMPHRVGLMLAFLGIADTIIDTRRLRTTKQSTD